MQCRLKYPVITLTTDFGLRDHYVGSMKGIILKSSPTTPIVDISHEIPTYSIDAGAYTIAQAAPCFPPNTIHVVVVDPGVGTARRAIAVEAGGQIFIAPDNGVLTMALAECDRLRCFEIQRKDLMRSEVSATFHGRDVFAPAAAALASGRVTVEDVGPEINDLVQLADLSAQEIGPQLWRGKIVSIDRFGNLITTFRSSDFASLRDEIFQLQVGLRAATDFRVTFGEAEAGKSFAYFGSSGFIEVALNRGNAADYFQAKIGGEVELQLGSVREPGA